MNATREAEQKVAVAFKWKSKSLINHVSRHSAHPPPLVLKPNVQGRAANQSFRSHIFPPRSLPALFPTDLRRAQKGESTYLIRAIFDNLFHFTQHTQS